MTTTAAQKRASARHRAKLKHIKIDFNTDKPDDIQIFNSFENIAHKLGSRKIALAHLMKKYKSHV